MKRIYTKTGDKGTTGLHGGSRVDKDDIRIETNGTIDELNAQIGIVRALLPDSDEWQDLLYSIQLELMTVMSHVATPPGRINPNPLGADELAGRCEQVMDEMTARLENPGYFILPGGTLLSAQLQMARTIVRRAERRLWTLHRTSPVDESIMRLFNRLSDLFSSWRAWPCSVSSCPKNTGRSLPIIAAKADGIGCCDMSRGTASKGRQ